MLKLEAGVIFKPANSKKYVSTVRKRFQLRIGM
jgi:hypothetical protein